MIVVFGSYIINIKSSLLFIVKKYDRIIVLLYSNYYEYVILEYYYLMKFNLTDMFYE